MVVARACRCASSVPARTRNRERRGGFGVDTSSSPNARRPFPEAGGVPKPFFGRAEEAFTYPRFPFTWVTRLAGYDFQDVRALVDRSLAARNRGRFVIDLSAGTRATVMNGCAPPPSPARELSIFDDTEAVLYDRGDVIGTPAGVPTTAIVPSASWDSKDPAL